MLSAGQRRKVKENIGLVHKVISDKVHGTFQYGMYSREDLFQIGCIGLCKAVASDRGGCFSTYAYRLIWNEICDALVSSTRKGKRENIVDVLPETWDFYENEDKELQMVLQKILKEARGLVPASTKKGIRAMLLMEKGYTSREIGEWFGVKANLVCAWVSKARKYLREQEELRDGRGVWIWDKENRVGNSYSKRSGSGGGCCRRASAFWYGCCLIRCF